MCCVRIAERRQMQALGACSELVARKQAPDEKLCCHDWQQFTTALLSEVTCLPTFRNVLVQFCRF